MAIYKNYWLPIAESNCFNILYKIGKKKRALRPLIILQSQIYKMRLDMILPNGN